LANAPSTAIGQLSSFFRALSICFRISFKFGPKASSSVAISRFSSCNSSGCW
jgi:hypothetical protein